MRVRRLAQVFVTAVTTLLSSYAAEAAEVSGAGSTFVYPILSKWSDAFRAASGVAINYQSIGSGGGIKQIESKTVDFGASDAPLPTGELEKLGILQFPIVIGGDVPVINLPGVDAGKLVLTGTVLADMYLGKVTMWNDRAIADLNPDIKLPSLSIAVIYRSDASGTTYIWSHYLSQVSVEWRDKVGFNTAIDWPTGIGARGNEGVSAMTGHVIGALGYVEYAYAKRYHLTYALLRNSEGQVVAPSHASFQAAAANADWAKAPNFDLMLTNQPGKETWPITGSTFILMYKVQDKSEAAQTALRFFHWAFLQGDKMADALDYVPLPPQLVSLVESTWKGFKRGDGAPLWTASRE